MAGQRQPTDLVVMNGRKHLTKAEIEARKNAEVTAPCDKVRPPSYLTPEQKKQFRKIAKELLRNQTVSNLELRCTGKTTHCTNAVHRNHRANQSNSIDGGCSSL